MSPEERRAVKIVGMQEEKLRKAEAESAQIRSKLAQCQADLTQSEQREANINREIDNQMAVLKAPKKKDT